LDHGQAGLLVPPKDSNALAGVLVQLLSNANMLHEWKHRANQNLEWLSVDRVHQETLAVYGELITAKP
jgi:glycosyltransferase involved in cell wall biosynthesis